MSLRPLRALLQSLLQDRDCDPASTIRELATKQSVDLRVAVLNKRTAAVRFLSSKTDPDCRIIDAVCASMSIPLLFKPMRLESSGDLYCDAGLVCSETFTAFPPSKTLALVVRSDHSRRINPISQTFECRWDFLSRCHVLKGIQTGCIVIQTPPPRAASLLSCGGNSPAEFLSTGATSLVLYALKETVFMALMLVLCSLCSFGTRVRCGQRLCSWTMSARPAECWRQSRSCTSARTTDAQDEGRSLRSWQSSPL